MENEPNMTPSNTNQQIARRGIYLSVSSLTLSSRPPNSLSAPTLTQMRSLRMV